MTNLPFFGKFVNESFAHSGGMYGNLVVKSCPIGDDDEDNDMASNFVVDDDPFNVQSF